MPQLVGMHLDEAQKAAEQWDLYVSHEDASGEDRDVWLPGNWTVVSQSPRMGTAMQTSEGVKLTVLKNEEAADAVSDYLSFDEHIDEARFTGRVTGYGDVGDAGASTVMVDDAIVRLALIDPIAENCGIGTDVGLAHARAAKEDELPIGTHVLVVRADDEGSHAFLHRLEDGSDPAGVATLGSSNEQLVRTGWWTPSSLAFEGGFQRYSADGASFLPFVSDPNLSAVEAEYAPYIATAGNEAVAKSTAGLGMCAVLAENDAAAWAAALAEQEERLRLWNLEYEERVRNGYYTCRDGDGDGVCYEN
jgi:hypothetical protein